MIESRIQSLIDNTKTFDFQCQCSIASGTSVLLSAIRQTSEYVHLNKAFSHLTYLIALENIEDLTSCYNDDIYVNTSDIPLCFLVTILHDNASLIPITAIEALLDTPRCNYLSGVIDKLNINRSTVSWPVKVGQ